MERSPLSEAILEIISSIPSGKVATYGQIAELAGNKKAARLVVWLLNSSSDKHDLPWHRVINRLGKISLETGYELQKEMLQLEGVQFGKNDVIDLNKYGWVSFDQEK